MYLIGKTSIKCMLYSYRWTSLLFIYTINKTFAPDKHVYTCYMFIEMKKFHDGEAVDEGEAAVVPYVSIAFFKDYFKSKRVFFLHFMTSTLS